MKYMKWSDLKPGDVLRYTDNFIRFRLTYTRGFNYDKDLIIDEVSIENNSIIISFKNTITVFSILDNGIYCKDYFDLMDHYRGFFEKPFKVIKINENINMEG